MNDYSQWFFKTRLKSRQMLLLVAIAEEGNIHKAAKALFMTQPSASKLLKDLETMLEVDLFERLPRGMVPTPYGEMLIRQARIAVNALNRAHEQIQSTKNGFEGLVRIGCISSPALAWLPNTINALQKEHPRLQMKIEISTSNVLVEKLLQTDLDLAVARLSPSDDREMLHYEPIADEPVSMVARKGHPLANHPDLTLEILLEQSWVISPAGSALRVRFDSMLQSLNRHQPSSLIEASSLLFITKMMQQSNMVSLIGTEVAQYYEQHGMLCILPIQLPFDMDPFGLVFRKDIPLSPVATRALQGLRQTAAHIF
jgi:DNA-binding transcriptional LysR family regulator